MTSEAVFNNNPLPAHYGGFPVPQEIQLTGIGDESAGVGSDEIGVWCVTHYEGRAFFHGHKIIILPVGRDDSRLAFKKPESLKNCLFQISRVTKCFNLMGDDLTVCLGYKNVALAL